MGILRSAKGLVIVGTLVGCTPSPNTKEWDESWGRAILDNNRVAAQICGNPDLNQPGTRVYEDCQRRMELRRLWGLDRPYVQ